MKLNRGLYFGDLVASPIAIVVLTTVALVHRDFEAVGLWGLALFAGLGAWTLVEYAVHRWVYHRVPFFKKLHDAHHESPRALIGAPLVLQLWHSLRRVLCSASRRRPGRCKRLRKRRTTRLHRLYARAPPLPPHGAEVGQPAVPGTHPTLGAPLSEHARQLRRDHVVLGLGVFHETRTSSSSSSVGSGRWVKALAGCE
jgi:hypothetical protein